jgi:hypothetical protein
MPVPDGGKIIWRVSYEYDPARRSTLNRHSQLAFRNPDVQRGLLGIPQR